MNYKSKKFVTFYAYIIKRYIRIIEHYTLTRT